ncbi:DUF4258 domain-containing protein [Acidobacteriota bacterium]
MTERYLSIKFHPHAQERMLERGATVDEVRNTINKGERFRAKFGRSGFRMKLFYDDFWKGHYYYTKQLEVYGVEEGEDFIVITVIVKYFQE